MLEALEKSLGIVTSACRSAGVGRTQHYNWLKDDPAYKAEVESISDIALDFAETELHKRIRDQDTTAIIFYLKTKGRKRGYVERLDHGLADLPPSKIVIEISGEMPDIKDNLDSDE